MGAREGEGGREGKIHVERRRERERGGKNKTFRTI